MTDGTLSVLMEFRGQWSFVDTDDDPDGEGDDGDDEKAFILEQQKLAGQAETT